jgi:hypothetical protein
MTADVALRAMCTVLVGLTDAMKTLEALQSETSDFPVNLPVSDAGEPVLNLASIGQSVLRQGRGPTGLRHHEAPAPISPA